MRSLLALCREVAVTWWRELPPLVRSRQFLFTTLMLICVGLLMAFTQIVQGGRAPGGFGTPYAAAQEAAMIVVAPLPAPPAA
jgi:hypothetical protein